MFKLIFTPINNVFHEIIIIQINDKQSVGAFFASFGNAWRAARVRDMVGTFPYTLSHP